MKVVILKVKILLSVVEINPKTFIPLPYLFLAISMLELRENSCADLSAQPCITKRCILAALDLLPGFTPDTVQ